MAITMFETECGYQEIYEYARRADEMSYICKDQRMHGEKLAPPGVSELYDYAPMRFTILLYHQLY
jgi:hypothetical protein